MTRIRIFASFDGDNDVDLQELLESQAQRPGSAFELSARSQGSTTASSWDVTSRGRIRAADEMVVICGEHTDASPRMAAELRIAQEEGTPYLLLWGRREQMCTKPVGAKPSDPMYSWAKDVLESQMSTTLRNAKPPEVPESCKGHQR